MIHKMGKIYSVSKISKSKNEYYEIFVWRNEYIRHNVQIQTTLRSLTLQYLFSVLWLTLKSFSLSIPSFVMKFCLQLFIEFHVNGCESIYLFCARRKGKIDLGDLNLDSLDDCLLCASLSFSFYGWNIVSQNCKLNACTLINYEVNKW